MSTYTKDFCGEISVLLVNSLYKELCVYEVRVHCFILCIMKTCLSKYIEILPPENENFQLKNSGSFHISAQNIDCGYLLELPCRGSF